VYRSTAALIVTVMALAPASTAAQSPAAHPVVTVSYEVSRDRFQYRFENPSRFDTPDLVPHEFTQTYWGDNQWGVVTARYRIAGSLMESEVAATPQRTTRGDDVDSFFQPTGDVVRSGTTGNVNMRSLRVRQSAAIGRAAGLSWHGGYQYRRDRSVFHPRQTKTVSHSQPPSADTFTIEGSETTLSETHEVRVGVSRQWAPARSWRVAVAVDAAPATHARLTTILPFKYPGRRIVFSALVFTLNPTLTITRGTRWPIVVSVASTQTFSYLESRQFKRRAVSATIGVGRRFE
jgi:hypothetical protein